MKQRIVPRRGLAIARKEMRHIWRSPINLFLVAIAPAFLLLTLGYVFSLDVGHIRIAVLDSDQTEISRTYISRIAGGETISVAATVANYDAIDARLIAGDVDAGIIIPPDFSEKLLSGEVPKVQVLADGSNALVGSTAQTRISGASALAIRGMFPHAYAATPFEVRARVWYNPNLKSLVGMIPGLLAIVLTMPALALSLSLTREKELGTLEGLVATPMRGIEYLLGKMAAYMVVGVVGLLLSWVLAVAWFRVPFMGSLGLLVGLTLAYYLATMGFSLVTSAWLKSQQTALFTVMMIFFVPSFFLTGLIFPVDRSKPGALATATMLPATHYITIARGIFLKGTEMQYLVQPTAVLLLMGFLALAISVLAFKKRVG